MYVGRGRLPCMVFAVCNRMQTAFVFLLVILEHNCLLLYMLYDMS